MKNKAYQQFKTCIDACLACTAVCNHCASSCTQQEEVKMTGRCISIRHRICGALLRCGQAHITLGSTHATVLYTICADACDYCALGCCQHQNKHCQECAELYLRCAE